MMGKTDSGEFTLRAGDLDTPIRFQQPANPETNAYNEKEFEWLSLNDGSGGLDWAMVQYRDGREAFEADRLAAVATTIFTIRYRDDITERMRIQLMDEDPFVYYDIQSIAQVGRRVALRIVAIRSDHEMEGD